MGGLPKTFWWLWWATLVNRLGTFLVPFLSVYLTTTRHFSAFAAGLVLASYGLGSALGSLFGGRLSDHWGRRPTLCTSMFLAAAATAALDAVTAAGAIGLLALMVGVSTGASRPTIAAMIADVVPAAERARAFAINYWAVNLGFGLSALGAGLLLQRGFRWLFLADAVTTAICGLLLWARVPETRRQGPATRSLGTVARAIPAPWKQRIGRPVRGWSIGRSRLLLLCVVGFLGWVLFYQGASTLSVAMVDSGLSARDYGLAIAVNGLCIVILQLPVTRMTRGWTHQRSLVVGALLTATGMGATSLAGASLLRHCACVMVWTLGEVLFAPAAVAAVASTSPAGEQGRSQGFYYFSTQAAVVIAPPLGGALLDNFAPSTLWLTCAAVGLLVAGTAWLFLPDASATQNGTAHFRHDAATIANAETELTRSSVSSARPRSASDD